MAGQQQLDIAGFKAGQSLGGALHQRLVHLRLLLQRVVHGGDIDAIGLGGAEDPRDLRRRDLAALPGHRIDAVHALHPHPADMADGLEGLGDGMPPMAIGPHHPIRQPVKRDVVIARHGEQRGLDGAQKACRLHELRRAAAMGQIARHHHQIGAGGIDQIQQRLDQGGALIAEMQVRQMQDPRHAASRPSLPLGTSTFSAPLRMRMWKGESIQVFSPSWATYSWAGRVSSWISSAQTRLKSA